MNKKITASVLAGAMAISMTSISAFAADATQTVKASGEQTFSIDAGFTAPAIDVILPTSILAAINPYHLELELDATNNLETGTHGISSPEYTITNNDTVMGINVAAKLSAKGGTGVYIAAVDRTTKAAPTFKNDETEDKNVFAYLNTTKTQGTYASDVYDPADPTQLVFTEDVPEKATQLLALDVSESGYFQVQGDVVEKPATKWATGDKVTLNVIFDLTPYNPAIGGGVNPPVATARVTGATATAQGTAIAAGNIVVNSTAKTITITSGASVGNTIAVTLTLDTGNTLGTVTATDGSKFASPTATGNVISGTFIAAGGGFTVLVNNGTDDETWTVTIN